MSIPLSHLTSSVIATGLAECIAVALADNTASGTLGRPGRICLVPGNEVPWDACECGQLAIGMRHGPFGFRNFPQEALDMSVICLLSTQAWTYTVVLNRCQYHPPMHADGTPPTEASQTEAFILQQTENYFARNAIFCCLKSMKDSGLIDEYAVGASDYFVLGDCGSITIPIWVGVY